MTKPVTRFKVFPEKDSTLYWVVELYQSRAEMLKAFHFYRMTQQEGRVGVGGKKTVALTAATQIVSYRRGKARSHPSLGKMFFAFGHTGTEVVAHESCHAARYFFNRKKVDIADLKNDERLAYAVGKIARDIARRVW